MTLRHNPHEDFPIQLPGNCIPIWVLFDFEIVSGWLVCYCSMFEPWFKVTGTLHPNGVLVSKVIIRLKLLSRWNCATTRTKIGLSRHAETKSNFRMKCPGDFKQLPLQRFAVPVTRTLNQTSIYYIEKECKIIFDHKTNLIPPPFLTLIAWCQRDTSTLFTLFTLFLFAGIVLPKQWMINGSKRACANSEGLSCGNN